MKITSGSIAGAVFACIAVGMLLSCQPQQREKPAGSDAPVLRPVISFKESEFDFGDIKEGEIAEHVFKFTNIGKAPLVIVQAVGSCGCTVPEWPKEPVAPGESGEILVQFNSKNKPGKQHKTVTVRSNSVPEEATLSFVANVIPGTDASVNK